MTITAREIRDYINSKGTYGEMQEHKILYYIQGWSLALRDEPIFADRIEAWTHGPVVPSIRHTRATVPAPELPEDIREFVDEVFNLYRGVSGTVLADQTHSEDPWITARAGIAEDEASSEEITHSQLQHYFTRRAIIGESVPRIRQKRVESADPDLALKVAKDVSRRWPNTIAALGA